MRKKITVLFFIVITAALSCKKDDNDEQQPSISIEDMALNEGNSGTANFEFTITLSHAYSKPVGVHYSTADGTR